MNRRRIIIIVILLCFAFGGAAAGLGVFNRKKPADTSTAKTGDVSTKNDYVDDEDDNPESLSTADDQPAIIDGEEAPLVTRKSKYTDEVFNITLKYCNDYDVDTEHFTLKKALIVQDLMNDYMFINFKANGKTRWECYDYDINGFRDESQKTYEKEYNDYLRIKKTDDDDHNIYYDLPQEEINAVNKMY